MTKIAFFLEGQTELLFCKQVLIFYANNYSLRVEETEKPRSSQYTKSISILKFSLEKNPNYCREILLYDSGGDTNVTSDIKEFGDKLFAQGFQNLYGFRDLHPLELASLERLLVGLNKSVSNIKATVQFIISVQEIETWFIADNSHFGRIHASITPQRIFRDLGIDVSPNLVEQINTPSRVLSNIYWLERIPYDKSKSTVMSILAAIDMSELINNIADYLPSLKLLTSIFDGFLRP